MRPRHLFAFGIAGLIVSGCGGEGSERTLAENQVAGNSTAGAAENQISVADALAASPDHRTFVEALQGARLFETLRGPIDYTIFAPTDAAFAALSADARRRLTDPEQRDRTVATLSVHIVAGRVTREDIERLIEGSPSGTAALPTVTGDRLSLARNGETILVGRGGRALARLSGRSSIQANGVIHPIDAALIPGAP